MGRGIATRLAEEGWNVGVNYCQDEPGAEETAQKIRDLGREAWLLQADVGFSDQVQTMFTEFVRQAGTIELLVNNAGVAPKERKDILEAGEESYEWVMKVNLQGPYFLTQRVANWMIRQKHEHSSFEGCIINVTSVSSTAASPNRGEYCISKAGLTMASQLWAVRLAEFGIPVFEVRPGITATDMTAGVKEKYDALIAEGILLQPRWGTPADVGHAVAALARGDFPYSTGQVIMVDGGLLVERL